MNLEKLADYLNLPEVRGELMKDLAFIEWDMDMLLMFYFSTNQRHDPFYELVIPRLGFNDKLSIIESIPFKKRYKSLESLKLIRQLQQARNLAAHGRHLTANDKKIKNANWGKLFENYPNNYKKSVQKIRASISKLINTKEVIDHFAMRETEYQSVYRVDQ